MQHLCLSRRFREQLLDPTLQRDDMNALSHVRVDDGGKIIAVFKDESELDVTDLFSESMIDDYRDHSVLEHC